MTTGTTLLAFDFDGTLAPIRDDPAAVQMTRGAAALIAEATHIRGVTVAVLSGRDAMDVGRRIGSDGVYVIGSHGLEIVGPAGVLVRDAPPLQATIPDDLLDRMHACGLRLEHKKHGLALHWRGLDHEVIADVAGAFRTWAQSHHLDVIEGRCVVEARCHGTGKEEALRWLASAIGASRVVYAGDDVTDFGALRFAAENGMAVFVASSERIPPPGVTVVESFLGLFRLIREKVMM